WIGRGRTPEREYDEERESVFEARGFWARLLARLAGWFRRQRRPGTAAQAGPGDDGDGERPPVPPVRQQYLEVLVAARRSGRGRAAAETADEFERRLRERLEDREAADLAALGRLYSTVRYGDAPAGDEDEAAARDWAERVVAVLDGPPEN